MEHWSDSDDRAANTHSFFIQLITVFAMIPSFIISPYNVILGICLLTYFIFLYTLHLEIMLSW